MSHWQDTTRIPLRLDIGNPERDALIRTRYFTGYLGMATRPAQTARRRKGAITPDREAIVTLVDDVWTRDKPMIRPALFLFRTSSGFGWVEGNYLDPVGSPMPADHVWEGRITCTEEGFVCEGERGTATVVAVARADRSSPIVASAMRSFAESRRLIDQRGRTMDEERKRLYALLAEEFE